MSGYHDAVLRVAGREQPWPAGRALLVDGALDVSVDGGAGGPVVALCFTVERPQDVFPVEARVDSAGRRRWAAMSEHAPPTRFAPDGARRVGLPPELAARSRR